MLNQEKNAGATMVMLMIAIDIHFDITEHSIFSPICFPRKRLSSFSIKRCSGLQVYHFL